MPWYPAPESDDEREERLRPEPAATPVQPVPASPDEMKAVVRKAIDFLTPIGGVGPMGLASALATLRSALSVEVPASPAVEVASDEPSSLADLRAAIDFLDQVRAAPAEEEATRTGAFRDAREWLERAARQVVATPPAVAVTEGDYPPLPQPDRPEERGIDYDNSVTVSPDLFGAGQMRAYVDADRTARAITHAALTAHPAAGAVHGLTDEQIDAIIESVMLDSLREYDHYDVRAIVRAALAATTTAMPASNEVKL